MGLKVAVVGATGAVGREMLADLEASRLGPDVELTLWASPRSAGTKIVWRDKAREVRAFSLQALQEAGPEFVLMSAGSAFSREWAKALAALPSVVIDNSSAWRRDLEVPLVVPEVNRDALSGLRDFGRGGIVANPNCSTIQCVVALKPLHDAFGIHEVHVASYQSVSGAGQRGIEELGRQMEAQLRFGDLKSEVFPAPIAMNILPAIGTIDDAGHCEEESKIVFETRRLLGLPDLAVFATTVRVPTLIGHGEAVHVRLGRKVTRDIVRGVMMEGEGLRLVLWDDLKQLPTPRSVAGDREVSVARVRLPMGAQESSWVQFWCIADNLKKGAATNAVQILECLVAQGFAHRC